MRSLGKGFDILKSEIRIDLDTLSFLGVVNNGIDISTLYCVIKIAKNITRVWEELPDFGNSFF